MIIKIFYCFYRICAQCVHVLFSLTELEEREIKKQNCIEPLVENCCFRFFAKCVSLHFSLTPTGCGEWLLLLEEECFLPTLT